MMMKWHHRSSKRIDDPWIVELLRSFKLHELQDRSFGLHCCRVLENEAFYEEYDAFLKLITDGECVIGALFTSNSVKDFYARKIRSDSSSGETNEFNWKKMILLLEEFKIVHRMTCGEYGELVLQVDKFSLIGNYPNILDVSSTMILEHANKDSVVQKKCQDIWERKQLNENSESLQLDTDTFLDCRESEPKLPPWGKKVRISLENVTSAKSFLVISEKEKGILDSIPGWNTETTEVSCTSKRSIDNEKTNCNKKLRADNDVEEHQDDDDLSSNPLNVINRKDCLINHNSQNVNCIPTTNVEETPEKEEILRYNHISNNRSNHKLTDRICDETYSRTAENNKLESDSFVHSFQIPSQSEESSFHLNLESSLDNSEIILDNYESALGHKSITFAKQCTHRLILENKRKKKKSYSSTFNKSPPNNHFKRKFIHELSQDKEENRLLATNCHKSTDSVDSPNQRLGNSLVGVFQDNASEWKFSADHIRAMCDKFLELFSEN